MLGSLSLSELGYKMLECMRFKLGYLVRCDA